MTYALIDNATLTAVQRITGQVASRSRDSADVDLAAYENFVQARLFYDDLVAIDDYIPRFRDERRAAFPNASFVDATELRLKEIASIADQLSEQIRPTISGGDFANAEFKALFYLLQTHMVCTWDIASSIYHLTLKVLAEDGTAEFQKYGAVATAIFQELSDASEVGRRVPNRVELVDRFGSPITEAYKVPDARWGDGSTGAPSGAIGAFVAALVWLSNRAIFYTLASSHLRADSFLYPIRQAYQQHYISQTCQYGVDYPKRLVRQLSAALSKDVVDIHASCLVAAIAIDLPIFSVWLADKSGDTAASLYALEDIRKEQEFVEARGHLSDLREVFDTDDIAAANKKAAAFLKSVTGISNAMREKYSVRTQQGVPVTRLVTVYNTVAGLKGLPPLPKLDFTVKIPQFVKDMRREFGFCAVYRNVVNDLATFGSLGAARDNLGKRINVDSKAYAYSPKAESPRFRKAHSPFKSPM